MDFEDSESPPWVAPLKAPLAKKKKRDAYEEINDSDEEWSTLPVPAKKQRTKLR
jgi:hypothetical protein